MLLEPKGVFGIFLLSELACYRLSRFNVLGRIRHFFLGWVQFHTFWAGPAIKTPCSFTKNQEDEVSKGKRYEVVVHGRVEALAASDDDANKEVADDSAEEDDHVEDGHQHKTHLDMFTQ